MNIFNIRPPRKRAKRIVIRSGRTMDSFVLKKISIKFQKVFAMILIFLLTVPFGIWPEKISHAEGEINVYYSVGQSNTTELMTGSPDVTVSNGTATFTVAQTGNIGVGDRIIIGETTLYISGKVDASHWNVVTNTGAQPADILTPTAVTHIYRTFDSLNAAIGDPHGATSLLGTTDLTSGSGYILNIPVYYDTGPDAGISNGILIRNITTSAAAYIHIYAPAATSSEVNQSQRHDGKWKADAFRLESMSQAMQITANHVVIDGLQIKNSVVTSTANHAVYVGALSAGNNRIQISNNIIVGAYSGGATGHGITPQNANDNVYIYNNIVYGFNGASYNGGIYSYCTVYAYNNIFYGNGRGISRDSGTLVAKNNISYNNGTDYSGAFSALSTHNLSADASAPALGTYYRSKTLTFTNTTPGTEDFHLISGDTNALNKGIDLSADADGFLSFSSDVDGQTRSGTWDLGADDLYVAPDAEDPAITNFDIPSTATSRNISISAFEAADNVAVTGYLISESAATPEASNLDWSGAAPTAYTVTGTNTPHILYAWTMDGAENISASASDSITITPTAANCSQADIQAELDVAQDGDTILVPTGACTWTTDSGTACSSGVTAGVCMTKGVKLQGGSGGTTEITLGSGFTRGGLQIYPDASSLSANATFEVTGFTFNGDNQSMNNEGLLNVRSSYTEILNNLKIHNNIFKNVSNKAVVVNGAVNGVVYENIFTDTAYSVVLFGGDAYGWATFTRDYGQSSNLFIEDNTINFTTDMVDIGGTDHGQGAPGFVFRYNTFDLSNTTGGWAFTIHGLQSMAVTDGYTCSSGCGYSNSLPFPEGSCDETEDACAQWSTVKSEYYGNRIVNATNLNGYMTHRGSWLMMFYNDITGAGSSPPIKYAQYACDSCQSPASPAYSQHVQNSYIFDNQYNSTNVEMTKGLDFCGDMSVGQPYTITEDVDYWNENADFNGTSGVGVGTLANRPSTCSTGVGYWATNQNTSDLASFTGTNPSTSISGTFYKCTAPDTWSAYYTPYTYPHPLRSESESVAPQITAFTVPATASSLTVNITIFTATDNSGTVTGYELTESETAPLAGDAGWTGSAPATYTFSSAGSKTLYAWAKDAAGNISTSQNDSVTITLPVVSSVGGGGGGGGGTPAQNCSSVVYGDWDECIDNSQTREVSAEFPAGCSLTASQEADKIRECVASEETEEEVISTTTETASLATIDALYLDQGKFLVRADINEILPALGNIERNHLGERLSRGTLINKLGIRLNDYELRVQYSLTNFITYGSPDTAKLGWGERAGVLNSFIAAFEKVPVSAEDWSDVIKIANGRWPSQRSGKAENRSAEHFRKVYLREPNRQNPNDDAAVTVVAYGLRPANRNMESEAAAIRIFKEIYKYAPISAVDWDAVRAIAYSGATR